MDDSGKTVTTTSNQEPWSAQQPYLKAGFDRASTALNGPGPEYYPGQTVADPSAATTQGQREMMDVASWNSDLNRRTAGGEYLDASNPHFQGMVNQIGQAIRPSIDSAFASSGRLGSGAQANAYASALADQAGKLAYQNYGDERGRQIAASQDYAPQQQMMAVGAQQEARDNQYIQDAQARWNFEQGRDANQLNQYMNVVGNRSYGQNTTGTQPVQGNSGLQAVGTVLGGLGAVGQFAAGTRGLLW